MGDQVTDSNVSSRPQWTNDDLNNAMLYGVCLVCMTPHKIRKTVIEEGGHKRTHWELVRPCGHTESDIDRELEHGF